MPATDEDGEVDLGVSLEVVATVVDLANAAQSPEEGTMGDGDEDEELDDEGQDPDLVEEDSAAEMLVEYIDELNEDQQAALIALAWVGRGDYDADGWDEALKLAYERNARGNAGDYLADMQGLGDLLAEGLAAFGLSVDDVER